jgi:transposase
METVLWIVRTGNPWRDPPGRYGNWHMTLRRFHDWREADVFRRIFDPLSDEPRMDYAMVSVQKVARGQSIGRSKREHSTVCTSAISMGK